MHKWVCDVEDGDEGVASHDENDKSGSGCSWNTTTVMKMRQNESTYHMVFDIGIPETSRTPQIAMNLIKNRTIRN
jgi:hypothetical protein